MQEVQFYFTRLTIISLGSNDACLVSITDTDGSSGERLSNILSLVYRVFLLFCYTLNPYKTLFQVEIDNNPGIF